jgi:fructokinase
MQIGIDLGGTKIEAIALDAELESETGKQGTVGIGIPGVVTHATGLVKNANSTWLIGRPLQADLESRLARPVRLANDANCFTLSEAIDGAGRGFETVFGVILGTGVGGGIAIHQRIHDGPNQIAGEWGPNPLPWLTDEERAGAPPRYCGKVGCIETFLSGPGFVNVLDPDAIVLGGGMSNLPDLASAAAALLPRYVFSDTVLTKVLPNVHGDSSGVRGAAWLWP